MHHSEFLFSFLIFMFLAHIYTAILRVRTYRKVDIMPQSILDAFGFSKNLSYRRLKLYESYGKYLLISR